MENDKEDLLKMYKKVLRCKVCKKYYGTDLGDDTKMCPNCLRKLRKGKIGVKNE